MQLTAYSLQLASCSLRPTPDNARRATYDAKLYYAQHTSRLTARLSPLTAHRWMNSTGFFARMSRMNRPPPTTAPILPSDADADGPPPEEPLPLGPVTFDGMLAGDIVDAQWTVVTAKPAILRADSDTSSQYLGYLLPGSVVWVEEVTNLTNESTRCLPFPVFFSPSPIPPAPPHPTPPPSPPHVPGCVRRRDGSPSPRKGGGI